MSEPRALIVDKAKFVIAGYHCITTSAGEHLHVTDPGHQFKICPGELIIVSKCGYTLGVYKLEISET